MAHAKPKVALVTFEGDETGEVSEVVEELLEIDYALSASKQVTRTIDKLGLDSNLSDKDLKKLANELEVDAIVRGDLQQKGTRKLLHVKLYLNGKKIRGFKVEFASTKSEKFKSALKDKMNEKLSGQEPKKKKEEPVEAVADDEDPIGGKKGKKKKGEETKADKAEKLDKSDKKAKGDEEEETADKADEEKSDEEKSDDEETDKPKKQTAAVDEEDIGGDVEAGVTVERSSGGRGANLAAVRLDLGGSASTRTLTFNSRNFEQAPTPYTQTLVGGVRVAGEIYPLAFGNPHSFLSGIGVAGHYDQTAKLNLESDAQMGTKFPVEQKHWGVGARFRIAFGKSQRSPTVTLGGGYFHRKFIVDRSQLLEGNVIDLPDVFYRGFDPGLEFRIPIIKQLAFLAGGQAVLVIDAGQIQQPYSYGRAKITGGQGMAGFDIVFAGRFALRVTGEFAQFGFAFTGNGQQTYDRDRDPATPDIGGAADRYFGGAATLAILY